MSSFCRKANINGIFLPAFYIPIENSEPIHFLSKKKENISNTRIKKEKIPSHLAVDRNL
jgi:hypothetical protein